MSACQDQVKDGRDRKSLEARPVVQDSPETRVDQSTVSNDVMLRLDRFECMLEQWFSAGGTVSAANTSLSQGDAKGGDSDSGTQSGDETMGFVMQQWIRVSEIGQTELFLYLQAFPQVCHMIGMLLQPLRLGAYAELQACQIIRKGSGMYALVFELPIASGASSPLRRSGAPEDFRASVIIDNVLANDTTRNVLIDTLHLDKDVSGQIAAYMQWPLESVSINHDGELCFVLVVTPSEPQSSLMDLCQLT
jgi:hypothetical protein